MTKEDRAAEVVEWLQSGKLHLAPRYMGDTLMSVSLLPIPPKAKERWDRDYYER